MVSLSDRCSEPSQGFTNRMTVAIGVMKGEDGVRGLFTYPYRVEDVQLIASFCATGLRLLWAVDPIPHGLYPGYEGRGE